MAQKIGETVYWDVLEHGERSLFMGMTEQGLLEVTMGNEPFEAFERGVNRRAPGARLLRSEEKLAVCKEQIAEYLAGERQVFDLPYDLRGTEFQKAVWLATAEIPYGKTCSYQDIAWAVGNGKAMRAVGGALNKNPIPIVIPCHRVIGKSGALVGFGGGLPLKVELLKIEGIVLDLE